MNKIIIIGGGTSGLAAAFYLQELKNQGKFDGDFILLEAANRFGGALQTIEREGFLLEGGADNFISEKPEVINLAKRLGIENELISTNDENRRAFIVREGKLRAVPKGFHLIAPSDFESFFASDILNQHDKIRLANEVFLPATQEEKDDESLAEFVERRFGKEILERVAQPMIGGIYGANPEKLSLKATQPRFLQLEKQFGSVIKGLQAQTSKSTATSEATGARYSLFLGFRKGTMSLINKLVTSLPENCLKLQTKVERLNFDGKSWQIFTSKDEKIEADSVILALPAHVIGKLLNAQFPKVADEFSSIEHASTATLNLAFRREQIAHPLDGFGFVVPFVEAKTLMAGTFSSVKFPERAPENHALIRAFIGGALQKDKFDLPEDQLLKGVLADLRELLGIIGEPLFHHLEKWADSMPQYNVGHLQKVEKIKKLLAEIPSLQVATTAIDGVGLPDAVRHGETAAEELVTSKIP